MATLIDLLRQLGQHAAPDGRNALVGPVVLPGVSDSPLTLGQPGASQLVAAWSRQVRRVTLGHHALALSAAQTNYSVALMGHGSAPHDDLLLLLLTQLQRQPRHVGLCIVPHEQSLFSTRLTALADTIGLSWLDATQPGARIRPASLVITTANELHRRILHFHDRSWRWLWPRLHVLALPELHLAAGVSAGHLHWVLRRVARLRPDQRQTVPLQVFSSLAPVADAEATLLRLLPEDSHYPLRVVAAPDGPPHNTLVALWRCGGDRLTPMARLVEQLRARRVPVAVLGRDAAETQQLRAALAAAGTDASTEQARVAIVSGVPPTSAARQALMRAGYRLLLLLAGDEPHELLFASQPELLLHTLPYWPLAVANPYISAAQFICAASERPVEEGEVDRWHLRELRDRLLKKGTLQPLPGSDVWQSTPEAGDPYAKLDLRTVGAPPALLLAPDGTRLGAIAPALLERRALPGQIFAPGLRVAERNEQAGTVQLAVETSGADTIVLAEVTAAVREEQAARTLHFGKLTVELIKGKVLATQQVVGLRELRPDGTRQRLPLTPAGETQWSAAACWLDLPPTSARHTASDTRPALRFQPVDPHTLGWSLAQVVPLIMLAPPGALVVAYVAEQQRLYLIEAEPGGVGLISGVYEQFERIVQLATQLTAACAGRPLYAQVAASEAAWLGLLSPAVLQPKATPAPTVQPAPTPAPQTVAVLPPKPAPTPTPVSASTPKPAPQPAPKPAARPSNILPFPIRRPALDRDETGSVERTAASIEESPSMPARVEQIEAAPIRARIYAGQRPIAPIQMPPAAIPEQQGFESPATPLDLLPPATQTVSTTEATQPSESAPEPVIAAVAQPHVEPVEAGSAAACASSSAVAAEEAMPVQPARQHATIYSVRDELDIADEQTQTADSERGIDLPVELDNPSRSSPQDVETTDDDAPVAADAARDDEPHLVAADAARDDEPHLVVAHDDVREQRSVTIVDVGIDDGAQVSIADVGIDDEPHVVAADVARDDEPHLVAADDDMREDLPVVVAQPEAEPDKMTLSIAPDQPLRAVDVDPDDDLPAVAAEAVEEQSVVAAEVEPQELISPGRRAAMYDVPPTVVEILAADDGLDVAARRQWQDQTETTRDPEVDAAATGDTSVEVDPAPVPASPQQEQPEQPAHRARRWQPAASARFHIDDLLPPLPSDEQEDQPDQAEADVIESTAETDSSEQSMSEVDAAPPVFTEQQDIPPDTRSRRQLRETPPARQFTERDAATSRRSEPPRREQPLQQREPLPSQRERPRSEQPGGRSSSYDRRGQTRPQPTPSNREQRGVPPSNREQPPRDQAPREPRGAPASNREQPTRDQAPREPRGAPPPNSSTPQRRANQSLTPRGRTPDRGERQPPAPRQTPDRPANAGRTPTPPSQEPTRPALHQPAPEPQQATDVGAMIDRMRRLRQQREAEQQAANQRSRPSAPRGAASDDAAAEPTELRFHIGERVQCLPYGVGRVRASRIVDERELVLIDFPDYGEIEVDPSINLVRQLGLRQSEANEHETPDAPDD